MEAEAMILIMDYKEYEGEERPVIMAFKHGLEEEKCWSKGYLVIIKFLRKYFTHPFLCDDFNQDLKNTEGSYCFKTDLT